MNCLHYKFNHIKRSLDTNRCISLDVIHLAILFLSRKDQRHLDKCPYGSKFQKKIPKSFNFITCAIFRASWKFPNHSTKIVAYILKSYVIQFSCYIHGLWMFTLAFFCLHICLKNICSLFHLIQIIYISMHAEGN